MARALRAWAINLQYGPKTRLIRGIYLSTLPNMLKQYNNTKHSSIKMTPVEASKKKNESTVYFNLYGDMEQLSSKPKFKVGD